MTTIPKFEPELDAYDPSLKEAAALCVEFAEKLTHYRRPAPRLENPFAEALGIKNTPGCWLTLSGKNGCGKTMFARQLFNYARQVDPFSGPIWVKTDSNTSRRPKIVWLDYVEFISRCKGGEHDLPEYLGEDWLVVLDDFGAARDKSGYDTEISFRFCNARREGFTIFTTNFERKDIAEKIDPRISSRMVRDNNRAITITAGDYGVRQTIARKSA